LYRIAVNYSINHIKKSKIRNTISIEIVSEPIEAKDKKSDELMDEETRRKHLESAIDTLPAQQRAVFNFRYYTALSYGDISRILNKSIGGVKANYFHAVKNLGECLKEKMKVGY
jgi:RNA polymerase sigma-70 factor (ECF subfamily)